ncbi:hypothetical protein FHW58_002937 [Duganella sp. 1224]|nr:hypothetical protein [Duganella sp. 1224]
MTLRKAQQGRRPCTHDENLTPPNYGNAFKKVAGLNG